MKRIVKLFLMCFVMFVIFSISQTKTYAAGGMLGGKYCNYEINDIYLSGDYIHVKGWFYRVYEHYTSSNHNYYVKVHSGSNYIGSYWDQNDYYVDHTELQYVVGDSIKYNYKDVGFHFKIPAKDLLNAGYANYKLEVHITKDGWDLGKDVSYMSKDTTIKNEGYTMSFNGSGAIGGFYIDSDRAYVRSRPSKTASIVKHSNGKNLYWNEYDTYSYKDGSIVGKSFDNTNKVTWYKARIVDGSSDKIDGVTRWRARKSTTSSKTGWASGSFIEYTSSDFYISISRNAHTFSFNANGGSGAPGNQTKYYGLPFTFPSTVPVRDGYRFTGWTEAQNGSGTVYQPNQWVGNFTDTNKTFYAQWKKQYYVDLNGTLNNERIWGLGGVGTVDLTIGNKTYQDISDWNGYVDEGTWFSISDVKAASGKVYTGSGTSLSGNVWSNIDINPQFRTLHTVDLNSTLDGKSDTKIAHGTVDVYVDGKLWADDVSDWYQTQIWWGSWVKITDFKTEAGYTYNGSNPYSVQITQNTNISLPYTTNEYTLTVDPNGGQWNGSDSVQYFKQKYTTTKYISNPTRKGFTFMGWKLTGEGSFDSSTNQYTYGVGNGVLTAQWKNYPPEITVPVLPDEKPDVPSNIPPFIDSGMVIVQKGDPVDPTVYVKVTDKEDGDISDRVVIEKNPIPYDKNGNTTEAGIYEVIVSVTDNGGTKVTETVTILVNDKPLISADDRYFYKNANVDKTEILKQTEAIDYEDGDISDKIVIDSIKDKDGKEVSKDKIDTSKIASFVVTYKVTDKYKASNTCTATFTIIDKDVAVDSYSMRYISKDYLNTLDAESSWKKNAALYNKLSSSLNKEATDSNALYVIEFDAKKSEEMKNYILNSTQDQNFNSSFINKFSSIFKVKPSDGSSRKQ